jgi:chemotaxis response regulator CheB
MPGVVAEAGLADQVLPLDALAAEVVRLATRCATSKPA